MFVCFWPGDYKHNRHSYEYYIPLLPIGPPKSLTEAIRLFF